MVETAGGRLTTHVLDTASARVKLSLSSKPPVIDLKEKAVAESKRALDALTRDSQSDFGDADPRIGDNAADRAERCFCRIIGGDFKLGNRVGWIFFGKQAPNHLIAFAAFGEAAVFESGFVVKTEFAWHGCRAHVFNGAVDFDTFDFVDLEGYFCERGSGFGGVAAPDVVFVNPVADFERIRADAGVQAGTAQKSVFLRVENAVDVIVAEVEVGAEVAQPFNFGLKRFGFGGSPGHPG